MQLPTERFLQALAEPYLGKRKNAEAYALFTAINSAFYAYSADSRNDRRWMTDVDMVGMLAACAYILLGYMGKPDQEIDWNAHDYILARTLRGFMRTLIIAIYRDGTCQHNGGTYFRGFKIPDWFVEWAEQHPEYHGPEYFPTEQEYLEAVRQDHNITLVR